MPCVAFAGTFPGSLEEPVHRHLTPFKGEGSKKRLVG